ncbi:MAG: high light inducible protein [Leptolyngbya sp. SIOISBB]|nr:high light inducible protein [Leptolyngbya sp. SIOISBB]
MNSFTDHAATDAPLQPVDESHASTEAEQPLSLPHQAEIWSGRFAMLGLTTAVMAIALM